MIWVVGERPVYARRKTSADVYCQMATALSPNFGAQITFRFLVRIFPSLLRRMAAYSSLHVMQAGLCASASMSIYGGSLADLFEIHEREKIWPYFALSPLLGKLHAHSCGFAAVNYHRD